MEASFRARKYLGKVKEPYFDQKDLITFFPKCPYFNRLTVILYLS